MIKPSMLKPGCRIGVVSPSYWLKKQYMEKTSKFFQDKGYTMVMGNNNSMKWGPFAGTPQERADDIHHMFSNPKIEAIICARGGYGANRVLPLLDYNLIRDNPKIFMGYSDITAYLTSITQKTGLVTFHGPMMVSYKKGFVNYNFQTMERILNGTPDFKIESPDSLPARILKPGIAMGPLWGGNMTLLINRLGTSDSLDTDGVILFLEDLDEYLYSFERMLVQMRTAGMLDNIAGLIIGELHEFKDQDVAFERNTDEIVKDI